MNFGLLLSEMKSEGLASQRTKNRQQMQYRIEQTPPSAPSHKNREGGQSAEHAACGASCDGMFCSRAGPSRHAADEDERSMV